MYEIVYNAYNNDDMSIFGEGGPMSTSRYILVLASLLHIHFCNTVTISHMSHLEADYPEVSTYILKRNSYVIFTVLIFP